MFDLDFVDWHEGCRREAVAMPLGGVGTGTVAVCGDGSLRQWQLNGVGNHLGFLPDSFFAIRSAVPGGPDVLKALEATWPHDPQPAPLVTDAVVPPQLRERHHHLPPLAGCRMKAAYPVAEIEFTDPDVPVSIRLQAFNPFVPADIAASSLPAALFQFELHNPTKNTLTGWLAGSLQNATGWDGVAPIRGTRSAGYGGAVNRVRRQTGLTAVDMDNASLPSDHPAYGQMVLATDSPRTEVLEQYAEITDFAAFLRGRFILDHHEAVSGQGRTAGHGSFGGYRPAAGPSPVGTTWNAAIAAPYRLLPGERQTIRFWMTWQFANRYVDFEAFGRDQAYSASKLWLGARYANRHGSAQQVSDRIHHDWDNLTSATNRWLDTARASDMSPTDREHFLAQGSMTRTVSLFEAADGIVYAFEGIQGASTGGWADNGGSCPLNCTHVLNYEQTVSRLFPDLEMSMRDTEFDYLMAPNGSLPHRVIAPASFVRQPWNEPVGGPREPAVDGMLGLILKTLREVQLGADPGWLERRWPQLKRTLRHIRATWEGADGLLHGPQPSTFDIPLYGANPYIGTYWLAAIKAASRLAKLSDDVETGHELDDLFHKASAATDATMWTGEYYQQILGPEETTGGSWGTGCLSDQLVGQWWAHQLGLGHLLPTDHVRTALKSIVRYNYREGFQQHEHQQRTYADQDDRGLLVCSWPHGGRPDKPIWYCDEVWTGVEFQVAATCRYEGLHAEADLITEGLWARHDGQRRNPFNHIECGDHYIRAMSGITTNEADHGVRYDTSTRTLHLSATHRPGTRPFFAGAAWGTVSRQPDHVAINLNHGALRIERVNTSQLTTPIDIDAHQQKTTSIPVPEASDKSAAHQQGVTA